MKKLFLLILIVCGIMMHAQTKHDNPVTKLVTVRIAYGTPVNDIYGGYRVINSALFTIIHKGDTLSITTPRPVPTMERPGCAVVKFPEGDTLYISASNPDYYPADTVLVVKEKIEGFLMQDITLPTERIE